jgi:hypothetical protein
MLININLRAATISVEVTYQSVRDRVVAGDCKFGWVGVFNFGGFLHKIKKIVP